MPAAQGFEPTAEACRRAARAPPTPAMATAESSTPPDGDSLDQFHFHLELETRSWMLELG